MFPYWIVWLIFAIIFFVVEAATINLTTVWFGIGAVVAMVLDLLGKGIGTQIVTFFGVSVVALVLFLLVLKPKFKIGRTDKTPRTNADRILDQEGTVIKTIDPLTGTGRVLVCNQEWAAATRAQEPVKAGTRVRVLAIEGVKAIVEPLENTPLDRI